MDENNASGLPSSQNGMPLSQNGTPLTNATFTTKEMEGLILDRKRYLATGYITTGMPLTTTYNQHPQGIIPEETAMAATYQTSTKTQEETTTFAYQTAGGSVASMNSPQSECCQTCHGQGCKIDHGAIRYAQTINLRTGKPQYVKVKEDTGTNVNWISQQLVNDCNFQLLDAPQNTGFLDFKGDVYTPKKLVRIPWAGKMAKTEHTDFFVAPENSPIDLVIGTVFIKSFGHSHTVFLDEPVGKALIMVQKKVTETERLSIQVAQAQADNKATKLERKRLEQQQRSSGGQSLHRGRHQLPPPSSPKTRGDQKKE